MKISNNSILLNVYCKKTDGENKTIIIKWRLTAAFGPMPGGGPWIMIDVINTSVWISCSFPVYIHNRKKNKKYEINISRDHHLSSIIWLRFLNSEFGFLFPWFVNGLQFCVAWSVFWWFSLKNWYLQCISGGPPFCVNTQQKKIYGII